MLKVSTMLIVTDLVQSKRFYVEVLGLVVRQEYSDRVIFDVAGHEVVMFQGDGPAIVSEHACDANSTLIFSVADLEQKLAHFAANGVPLVHDAVVEKPWGRYMAFSDPSGIVHEIFQAV